MEKNTVLKRFGYRYDAVLAQYNDDPALLLHYPGIDFIISVDVSYEQGEMVEDNRFFLLRDPNTGRFVLLYDTPPSATCSAWFKTFWWQAGNARGQPAG